MTNLSRRACSAPEQLQEAETVATSRNLKLQEAIVQLGYATGEQVMRALAEMHDYEYYDLNNVPIPPAVVELVPESVARENAVIPFSEEDGKLKVVVSDPLDFETFDKLQFILNRKVEIGLATREAILEAINRNYGQTDGESADSMLQEFTDTAIDFTETEDDGEAGEDDVVDETSAPIVRLVQLMITEAVQLRASDIHVEPFEDRVRIRYRIDGVLVERDRPTPTFAKRFALAYQDPLKDGHRRAASNAGWPNQDHRRRQRARSARKHAAHEPWPVVRDATSG